MVNKGTNEMKGLEFEIGDYTIRIKYNTAGIIVTTLKGNYVIDSKTHWNEGYKEYKGYKEVKK